MKPVVKLLRIKQAADILGVNPETLRRWDNEGRLPSIRIGSRRGVGDRRYKLEDIERYIEENKNKK